jgi:hypothetical protein
MMIKYSNCYFILYYIPVLEPLKFLKLSFQLLVRYKFHETCILFCEIDINVQLFQFILFVLFHCNFEETKAAFVGFEVLTSVTMKSSVFWDITPCSLVKVSRCFRGTYEYHLHLHDQRVNQA